MVVGWSLAMSMHGRLSAAVVIGLEPRNHYIYGGLEPRNLYTAGCCSMLEHADNVAAASQVQRGTQNTVARYVYRVYE